MHGKHRAKPWRHSGRLVIHGDKFNFEGPEFYGAYPYSPVLSDRPIRLSQLETVVGRFRPAHLTTICRSTGSDNIPPAAFRCLIQRPKCVQNPALRCWLKFLEALRPFSLTGGKHSTK